MKHATTALRAIAALCLLLLILPTLASCGSVGNRKGTVGELSWSYSRSKRALTVTGTGAIPDFSDEDAAPWNGLCERVTTVILEEGVTEVGSYAFTYMPALTSVQLPTTLTRVGDHAFSFCSSLTTVSIPEATTHIGNSAFAGCSLIANVYLPPSVISVGDSAFAYCYSMKSFMATAPEILVGSEAFHNCRSLKKLTFRSTLTEAMIAEDAFRGTELTFADLKTTDTPLGSTTVTIRYLLDETEVSVYEETFGYGVNYAIKTPELEGYTPSVKTVIGAADGSDREYFVIYSIPSEAEAPKSAISSASVVGMAVMGVALLAIGVVVFVLIRSDKGEKRPKRTSPDAPETGEKPE